MIAAAAPAHAQDLLSAYTGPNAQGYLAPLVDAFRSNLNAGLFHSARIEPNGFHVSLEFTGMATSFGNASRTFMARTDTGVNDHYVQAPTIVGDPGAVFTSGYANTTYAFPGGFDVSNWYLSAPQLRIGNWKGTEALARVILYDTGNKEIGSLGVWGGGVRHSISQYFPGIAPLDIAVAGMYQHARLNTDQGLDIVDSNLYTLALHTGMALGPIYPYAGLSIDWYRFGVHYETDGIDPIDIRYQTNEDFQLTLGASYQVGFVAAYGEYNFADQNTLAAGLSVNFPFSSRSVTQ
ncbi:MAG TPA: DUF6588 family protein [Candidatus Krumholzibacteria bacterium]|nr:DUF6588 family protein [Candidatus Krumholzibacteria bacterium]